MALALVFSSSVGHKWAVQTQPGAFWPFYKDGSKRLAHDAPVKPGWILESNMSVIRFHPTSVDIGNKQPAAPAKPLDPVSHPDIKPGAGEGEGGGGGSWGQGSIKTFGPKLHGMEVTGSARAYLAGGYDDSGNWSAVKYDRLSLLGKTLKFHVDVSNVGCNCEASVYLVEMPASGLESRSGYCDITGGPGGKPCIELDLIEANNKALQSSIHTAPGGDIQADGTCNERGCLVNWGKETRAITGAPDVPLYGPDWDKEGKVRNRAIDTAKKFQVAAHFSPAGNMSVTLHQGNNHLKFFNSSVAAVPKMALERTRQGLENGLMLAVALWTAPNMSFLDGNCMAPFTVCNLTNASFTIEDIEIVDDPTDFGGEKPADTDAHGNDVAGSKAGGKKKQNSDGPSALMA